jgi:hypothetical protein
MELAIYCGSKDEGEDLKNAALLVVASIGGYQNMKRYQNSTSMDIINI